MDKKLAIQQINDIYSIIEGNLKTVIPWKLMLFTGLGVMAIPGVEYLLKSYFDPFVISHIHSSGIFLIRTVFYWLIFYSISAQFKEEKKNALLEKVFEIGYWFPIIPVSVAAALAYTGYSTLISPIILILIGCLWSVFGQFTSTITRIIAWANIGGGIIGILLTQYSITHLWMYLVGYQGLTMVIMSIVLWNAQKNTIDQ